LAKKGLEGNGYELPPVYFWTKEYSPVYFLYKIALDGRGERNKFILYYAHLNCI